MKGFTVSSYSRSEHIGLCEKRYNDQMRNCTTSTPMLSNDAVKCYHDVSQEYYKCKTEQAPPDRNNKQTNNLPTTEEMYEYFRKPTREEILRSIAETNREATYHPQRNSRPR